MNDASTHHSPIDDAALAELRAFQEEGGPDILTELIDIFVEDTPERLGELEGAVESDDAHGIEVAAHTLKSSCAQLGAAHLSELCRQMEVLGREGHVGNTSELFRQAQEEWGRVRPALLQLKTTSTT